QSTAEADMALIRTKRATTSGQNGGPGQPKSKYRKRSRATPPGKCHSCNIRETPEWRRGPDGARTLCNACGLHYAKLMRKRDKAGNNADGSKPPAIDLEMLRASTRMQEASNASASSLSGGPNDP
ncbi:GATA-domain-containing protein, partial [Auriscalpium vulgare]